MRLFADNIPGPIAYLDRSLHYTFVNQAFANLGVQAAGRDLRQDAVRGDGRRTSPRSCVRSSSARKRASTSNTSASATRCTASGAGCMAASRRTSMCRHGPRPVLHRIRHPRPQADRAGAGRARGAAAALQRQHPGADRLSRQPSAATSSSTNRSWSSSAYASRRRSSARPPTKSGLPRSPARRSPAAIAPSPARRSPTSAPSSTPAAATAWLRGRCVPDRRFDGTVKGEYVVGARHHRPEAGAGRAGGARGPATRDHGRRAGAGRVYRP